MWQFLQKIFRTQKPDYAALIRQGGIVLDVRSAEEFRRGHVRGSINVPLEELPGRFPGLHNQDRPVITCCSSGARSATARKILLSHGYREVVNGGSWKSLGYVLEIPKKIGKP